MRKRFEAVRERERKREGESGGERMIKEKQKGK